MALNENDIVKYIEEFERIHDVQIVKIHPNSNQVNTYHTFHESKLSPEVIDKLISGEFIPNEELFSGDHRKRVIVANIDTAINMKFPDTYYLDMILLHELGHVKTMDNFTERENTITCIKQGVLTKLIHVLFTIDEIDKLKLAAEQHYIHHQFENEKAANDYFNIDTKSYYDDYYNYQPIGEIPYIDWNKLMALEVEDKLIMLYDKKFDMSKDERLELLEGLLNIANEIIIDDSKRIYLLENF